MIYHIMCLSNTTPYYYYALAMYHVLYNDNIVSLFFHSFLPKTHQFLLQNKIKIISARSQYEEKFPEDMRKWKEMAFQELADSIGKEVKVNCKSHVHRFLIDHYQLDLRWGLPHRDGCSSYLC